VSSYHAWKQPHLKDREMIFLVGLSSGAADQSSERFQSYGNSTCSVCPSTSTCLLLSASTALLGWLWVQGAARLLQQLVPSTSYSTHVDTEKDSWKSWLTWFKDRVLAGFASFSLQSLHIQMLFIHRRVNAHLRLCESVYVGKLMGVT
jgi:hypothetical protein